MKPTEKNRIAQILGFIAVLFLGFHAAPVTARAHDAATWQRTQEQKIRKIQSLHIKFAKMIELARLQHEQLERWHRLNSDKAQHLKSVPYKDKIHMARDYRR